MVKGKTLAHYSDTKGVCIVSKKKRAYHPTHDRRINHHHLLYQRRNWQTQYAKLLRLATVREVPIAIHNQLHHACLPDIPKPAEKLLESAYKRYLDQKTIVDALDILELILWLYNAIPDEAFRACMMVQYRFFDTNKGGR